MRVYRDLKNLPKLQKTVVTIGSFDGLHSGHQKIMSIVRSIAESENLETLVVTFHPHPRTVIASGDYSIKLLSSLDEKIELLDSCGIDHLMIMPFTVAYSQLSPQEYIEQLVGSFNPAHIVIGYDHRYGLDRMGDVGLLRSNATKYDYKVTEIAKQEVDEITISSTKIRNALAAGHLDTANVLLARPYGLSGVVIRGRKLGSELGYPTANVELDDPNKLLPLDGIYVCKVIIDGLSYKGMLYIGLIPTINDEQKRTIEVNIFDFDNDIYDKKISLSLLSYQRGDEKFDSLEALKIQLAEDEKGALAYFDQQETAELNLDTTVAILGYNSREYYEVFLPSISYSSANSFEVVVIDNNSVDDSLDYLREWHPEVKLIELDENHGFAAGYNYGLKNIQSKYIAFLNSDVQVKEGWLDPLIDYLEKHEEYAAVMPKILSVDDKESFEYAGACGGYMDALGYPYCRGRIFDTIENDSGQYDEDASVAWVSGAAFVMRADLFHKIGGFDESYFAHMEEIDLCWRLRRAGYKLGVIPSSIVYHLGGGTLGYDNPRKTFLNFRNSLYTLFKNEKAAALIWKIPTRLVLDGIAGLKFLTSGNYKSTIAIIRAHFAFYLSLPRLLSKRRESNRLIQNLLRGQVNADGLLRKSIVFQYYLSGIKKFSDLTSLDNKA